MAGQVLYLFRRYGRLRIYHPANGSHIEIDDLREWQREGVALMVLDPDTGADVTRVLLA